MQEPYLKVLGVNRVEKHLQSNGITQHVKFLNCVCKCGKEVVVRQSVYKTSSCGCKRVESNKSRKLDLSTEKFHMLKPLEYVDGKWLCECDCGNKVMVLTNNLRSGNTKSCGCLQKQKASKNMTKFLKKYRVSKNFSEDFQITSNDRVNRSLFRSVSKQVRKRDKESCQMCGEISSGKSSLFVHHIEKWSDNKEKRFDRYNLVTLCASCHGIAHNGNFHAPVNSFIAQCLKSLVEQNETEYAAREPLSAL